jgi:hypothetical protein
VSEPSFLVGIGGLILLCSWPLAQYFVLRDHTRRALLWIPINMVARLLGNHVNLPSPRVDQSTPTGTPIVIFGVAGLCMAATVALITGVGMIRLLQFPIKIGERPPSRLPAPAKSISLRT